MTQFDRMKALFDEFGVKHDVVEADADEAERTGYAKSIVTDPESPHGYWGFQASFSFDAEGKFVTWGVWE